MASDFVVISDATLFNAAAVLSLDAVSKLGWVIFAVVGFRFVRSLPTD